jgi:hypothetical protein
MRTSRALSGSEKLRWTMARTMASTTIHRQKVTDTVLKVGREIMDGGPIAAVAVLVLEAALAECGLGRDRRDLLVNSGG